MGTTIRDSLWRVTWTGTIGPNEIFAHGFWVTQDASDTAIDVFNTWQGMVNTFLDAPGTAMAVSHIHQLFPAEVSYLACTVRPYNAATGLPTADPTSAELVTPQGGSTGQSLPYQCAYAVTFWDGSTVGRSRYNRTYLPPFNVTVLSTAGKLAAGVPGDITAAWKAVDDAAGIQANPGGLCVFHKHAHTVSGCNAVRADHIVDTQRRRRDQLSDTFTVLALA